MTGGGDGEARRRRAAAAIYKPSHVKLLLVAEAPPAVLDRYFYFDDVREQDALFRYVVRGVLGAEPTRSNKPALLARLRDAGVFLIDLLEDPQADASVEEAALRLVGRVQALEPENVILIKVNVFDAAHGVLVKAGVPVVSERIPFPGSGQQRRFEAAFRRALASIAFS